MASRRITTHCNRTAPEGKNCGPRVARTPPGPARHTTGASLRKVLTYGTFDLFHVGHVRLLERLRALGDHLTVAVSTDEFNGVKGKKTVVPYASRAEIVAALRCVDAVIPEHDWAQKAPDIQTHAIHVFGMGNDWEGKFDELKAYCEVVYLPRTEGISSTLVKTTLAAPGSSIDHPELVR